MVLSCHPRRRSLEDLLSAFKDGCSIQVDRGARKTLVETIKQISEKQIKCTASSGEEFCLCERTVSSGSVGIDINDPFEDFVSTLALGDALHIQQSKQAHAGLLVDVSNKLTIRTGEGKLVEITRKEFNQDDAQIKKISWVELLHVKNQIVYVHKYGYLTPDTDIGNSIVFQRSNGCFVTISNKQMREKGFKAYLLNTEQCQGKKWYWQTLTPDHSGR